MMCDLSGFTKINKQVYLFVILCALSGANFAQKSKTVSGKVVDEKGQGVSFALILLKNLNDTNLINSLYTDLDGLFAQSVEKGSYLIQVNLTGYETYRDSIEVNKSLKINKIQLKQSATQLDEVEIIAKKSLMEMKLDKKVYNVAEDPNNEGANASEIMENVPSVTIDGDGNIQLRGSGNVRILINGRPSGLTSMGSAEALELLQGDLIESIEVITNPSSKYDAQGTSGIINIVLKKEKRKGVNGSARVSTGYPNNHSAGLNLTWQTKNINWTAAASGGYRKYPAEGGGRSVSTGDTAFIFERDRKQLRGGPFGNIQLSADIKLDSLNSLNIMGSYYRRESPNVTEITYRDFDQNGNLIGETVREDNEYEVKENIEGSVGHIKKFKKEGKEWSSDFNFYAKTDVEDSDITEDNPNSKVNQRALNSENEMSLFAQSDFTLPIKEGMKIESGVRNTYRQIENNFNVEQQGDNGEWFEIDRFSDRVGYSENVAAGYVQYYSEWDKFSMTAGLRNEWSYIVVDQASVGDPNVKNYNNLFPSAHTSYKIDSTNTIQLSYSRRINRPRFRSLLPFYSFSDNRSQYGGNPDLDPAYIHSFELSYLNYTKSATFMLAGYFRRENQTIQRITLLDETSIIRVFPVNLDYQNSYGLESNLRWTLFDWWKINSNLNLYYADIFGDYEQQTFDTETWVFTSQAQSNFEITDQWTLNITHNYIAPQKVPQGRYRKIAFMNINTSYQFMDKKARLTFSVKDVFRERVYNRIIEDEFLTRDSFFRPRERMFLLTFNYIFNNKKTEQKKSNVGVDMDDE